MAGKAIREALEPCPFCGGEAELRPISGYRDERSGNWVDPSPICTVCRAKAPKPVLVTDPAPIAAWNRRARTAYDAIGSGVKAPTIKPLPDQTVLQDQLLYDPATGLLHRKSGREAGKEAFTFTDSQGYRHGKIGGVKYQAHRIIWKLVHGVDPDRIDHINGDPSDNRLVNLRSCTVAENSRNYAKPRKTRGYRGVSWVKRDQAWAARISDGSGGKVSLGNHKTSEDAARAYDKAARQMHGEFAVLNFPEEI